MDPFEGSSSIRKEWNSVGLDCENEKSRNCSKTPCQKGSGDDHETVFTPMSNQADSNITQNGPPRTKNLNSVSSSESGQSSKLSENSECRSSGPSGSQSCNKVSSSTDQPESSRSSKDTNCDNGLESPEVTCQRHKVCIDKVNSYNMPSTSGASKSSEAESSGFRENRKRPSTLKLNRPNFDDSSSDTENDDYSLGSEDGCIYTYRGGEHLADLPSSFFSLDMGLPLDKHLPLPPIYPLQQAAPARDAHSRASSPDMDFLEMDFDPGPSCEVDTGDESTPDADLEAAANMSEENEPPAPPVRKPEQPPAPKPNPFPIASSSTDYEVPSTSKGVSSIKREKEKEESRSSQVNYGPYITHVNARGEQILVRRTMSHSPHIVPVTSHMSSGELISPRDMLIYDQEQPENSSPFAHQINQGERPAFDSANLSLALYHLTMAKKLMGEKTIHDVEATDDAKMNADSSIEPNMPSTSTAMPQVCSSTNTSIAVACVETPRCMVWSEREACERQVTQIGTSACGATAVVNVFIALGVPVNIERINTAVGTRRRANNAPLPRYLLSRAVAGCTAADLVNGLQRASDGLVTARFFPTHPERAMSLSHWLADWISLGAVPILTQNLQVGCEGDIPDAWHHQMVFGVCPRGVSLCNPLECVRESALWPRLTSPSVLLIRSKDILDRFTEKTDLTPLMAVPHVPFHTFNVLGQVVNVIREWRAAGFSEPNIRTRHIRIPASYIAGITVAALTGTEAHRRLMHAPNLPVLAPSTDP